jgi:NitT/TauT family transport system substrate-binding protein
MPRSRRDVLKLAAAGVAAAAIPGAPRRAHGQGPVKIGTAVFGAYSLAAPVMVAAEKGFFKEQGVDAEFVPFRGGPDLAKAVMAGEVLIGLTGSTDILVFREAGMPIKVVAAHGTGNDFVLVGAPEGPPAGELKGASIGVTRAGATTWVFARMVAKHHGWDPERDVKIVALGGLDAQLAALSRKEIGAFVWGDFGAVTGAQGRTKVLFRMESLTPRWISYIQYASEEAIRRSADPIRRVTRALFKAVRFLKANPQESVRITAAKFGWSPEAVLAVHTSLTPLFIEDGRINVEALRAMQDTLLEHGAIKKRLPLEDHFTTEFTPVRA